jgi:hypothetical protein
MRCAMVFQHRLRDSIRQSRLKSLRMPQAQRFLVPADRLFPLQRIERQAQQPAEREAARKVDCADASCAANIARTETVAVH